MIEKPKTREEEYFARLDFEKKQKRKHELHEKMKQEEKNRLKSLHSMRCPKCGMELIEIEHKTVRVDKCSECEGIWLDAGELDAILDFEKSTGSGKFLQLFRRSS